MPTQSNSPKVDPRYHAVCARDASADGTFFYAVVTTGVYCRPSCAARTPRPENVDYHPTTASARKAGYRPCKRCRPNEPPLEARRAELVAELCRHIETSEAEPTLGELADRAGLSVFHLHRLFKATTGVTPKAYATAHRHARVQKNLQNGGSVTAAVFDAGYGSGGRFYATSNAVLGMTPTRFRRGGERVEIRFAVGQCSLGAILVAATTVGVCAISLGDDPDELVRELERRFARADLVGGDAPFESLVAAVIGLVERPGEAGALPLDVRGTAFQRRVWQALRKIPAGVTISYAELAARVGAPKSHRAVAQACGANALAVAIPCHRVVRQDGALAGYRWGIERKRALLAREATGLITREGITRENVTRENVT